MEAVAEIARRRSSPLPGVAGNPDGLRHRHLLHLRRQSSPARRHWDYKRTCVEGPVFDAEKIVW